MALSTVNIIILSNLLIWSAVGLGIERILHLKREITDLRIHLLANQHEQEMRFQLIINQIKQQANKPLALNEYQHLFSDKLLQLRRNYPALTDTDVQVLILIGIGVPNHEIIAFTNMSKRTYYKRRQLIAQRMNTTAAQLDEVAKQFFTQNL